MNSILYMGCDIPDGNASAIRVYSNALALRDYGYKVNILSFDHDFQLQQSLYQKEMDGMCIYHAKYPVGAKDFFLYLFEKNTYKKVIDNIIESTKLDAVIVYDQPTISFLRVRSYCHKKDIAYLCDCAEWHSTAHLWGVAKAVKALDISLSMRYAYKKSDGLIAISSFLENYYKLHTKTMRLVPLQYQQIEYLKVERKEINIRTFIYAGTVDRDKDCLDEIISALSEVEQPFKFVVYGLTEQECLDIWPKEKTAIERIRTHAEISFYGRVKHEEVIKQIRASDFTFLIRKSSRKNNAGFPTKFAESIACGIPVISTNFSDVREYITKYKLGLIVEDGFDLVDSIEKAINLSTDELNTIKENCTCYQEFYYKSHVDEIGAFIKKCLKA